MQNKIFLIFKLIRLHAPTGFLLTFFPAVFGQILAAKNEVNLILTFTLFIGSILARGAGCIINDLLDKNFDRQVFRTKNRPLANNSLSTNFALTILIILLFVCFFILLTLSTIAIYIGLVAILMIALYPLTKRITNLPQLFLGLTFNLGCLIGYASVSNSISIPAFLMYLSCCMWTIGYDTIYAFMDLEDDKIIGVKSMAILLEKHHPIIWLMGAYCAFLTLFILANLLTGIKLNILTLTVATFILMWQLVTLKLADPQNCLVKFKANNYVGVMLIMSLVWGSFA